MDKGMEALKKSLEDDSVVHITEAAKRKGEYSKPFPIGYGIFDDAIKGGVREGDLIIGTGVSGQGKSTMFRNLSLNMSTKEHSSLWFSYEEMIDNMYAKFKEMGVEDERFKIYVPKQLTDDNVSWVQEKIKEGIDKYNTKFVFIDHLDYLAPKTIKRTSEHKRMVLGDICRELKQMAMALNVIIFLIAHVKKVQGRAIEMQDIAESGDIFKLADLVLGVQRHFTYETRGGQKMEVYGDTSSMKIMKNRIDGKFPIMDFYIKDSVIIPIAVEPRNDLGIEVVDDGEVTEPVFGIKD